MITLENRFFPIRSAVCFFVEGGIILLSVLASFVILRKYGNTGSIGFEDAVVRGIVVAFFCQVCMYMLDLYDLKHSQTLGEILFSLIFAVGFVCIGIGGVSYVVPGFGVEGQMYYLTIFLVAVLLLVWRIAFDYFLAELAPRENILIVGKGEVARLIANEIKSRERLGFRFAGFVGEPSNGSSPAEVDDEEVLGDYGRIVEIVRARKIRKLVVAVGERRGKYPVKEMLDVKVAGCQVLEWQGFFEKLSGRIPVDKLMPSFFIFNEGFRKSRGLLLVRRVFSMLFAATTLVIVAPLMALVGVAIKLDSAGPVFYSQNRIGQNGRIFRIFKFRSMRKDAEANVGARWAVEGDPRITRVGRMIRLTRLDELPQLFNVLRGDLDLVGPRPERPEFVAQLQSMIPYYSLRHTVKPGLTGWAQVMFTYCGTIEESKEKLQYDLFYIKNMSLKLELLILFRTFKIVLLGRGAR
ncbi:MAG: TIGR03013 family PEP-CTERM/XrtA system glycosyltransferase [Deltaproteobacteria bacterium]|nr:TIGR03013 family PEP-CTERM/XrtA system glycosyltransferase [Deltaproteobacteria bacterium]